MNLSQFTETKLLVPRLLSDQRDGAIQELAKRLETTERIARAPAFLDAVLKREAELPTFIEGVAVPHARGGAVRKLSIAVGLSADGIAWGLERRQIAHAIFLCAVPLTDARQYVSLLSGLSCLVQDQELFAALMRSTQPEEMIKVLAAVKTTRGRQNEAVRG